MSNKIKRRKALLKRALETMVGKADFPNGDEQSFSAQNTIDTMREIAHPDEIDCLIKERTTIYNNSAYKEMLRQAEAEYHRRLLENKGWHDDTELEHMDLKLAYQELAYKIEILERENAALNSVISQANIKKEMDDSGEVIDFNAPNNNQHSRLLAELIETLHRQNRIFIEPVSKVVYFQTMQGEKRVCHLKEIEDLFTFDKDSNGAIRLHKSENG